ncbi:MAG: hypothetical protein ABI041_17590, partial [Bdellovibrionia bacterium]
MATFSFRNQASISSVSYFPFKFEKIRFSPWVFGCLFFVLGKILRPNAIDPDTDISIFQVAGTSSIFLFWLGALFCWGRVFQSLSASKNIGIGPVLGFGSAFMVTFAGLLGHLGYIGVGSHVFFCSVLFLGYLLESYVSEPLFLSRGIKASSFINWFALLPLCLLVVWGVCLFAKALIPHFHSDPLISYLVGPRLWFQDGKISFSPRLPIAAQAAYWEYLHIWGNILLADLDGRGLFEAAVFAQCSHVALGWGGSVLVLKGIYKRLKISEFFSNFSLLVAVNSGLITWTIWLGKNDWGVTFWTLCGIFFWFGCASSILDLVLCGLFFGLAIGAKISSLFTIFPFLGFMTLARASG